MMIQCSDIIHAVYSLPLGLSQKDRCQQVHSLLPTNTCKSYLPAAKVVGIAHMFDIVVIEGEYRWEHPFLHLWGARDEDDKSVYNAKTSLSAFTHIYTQIFLCFYFSVR